jgi:cell division protease FtsH
MIQALIQTTGGGSAVESFRHLMLPAIHAPGTFLGYPDFLSWLHDWLPIILMALLVVAVFSLIRFMPRTRPAQIKPEASPPIGWSDIAGADEAKDELREVVDYLRDPKRFRELGAKVPKGILLHGPPGTGKTLLAKAVAHESGASFFSQSAASFVEMFVGVGAARIRRLFRVARKKAPAIVFIDELDAVGGHRGFDVSGERDQTLNQLLVELDGFTSSKKDVVVIAASNLLEKLDPALLRPGRFDRQIYVSLPDVGGRERILKVHTRNKPVAETVNFNLLARQTSGLTGADLANICNEAAIFAARRDSDCLEMTDFDAAIERVVAGVQSRRALTDHEKRVVAYHEAGHALCGELLPSVDRVHRISIVPHGRALGYTLNLPEEDRYLKTREELIDFMTMLLGGRAAEQLVFGSITTGASDDLKRVAEIARAMVTEYAMGTASSSMRSAGDDASESMRRLRDAEVKELADEAFRAALTLVDAHRPLLDALASTLLANEVLEREDIERIMGDTPPAAPSRVGELSVAAATALKPAARPRRRA